jgi:hypothetical protein
MLVPRWLLAERGLKDCDVRSFGVKKISALETSASDLEAAGEHFKRGGTFLMKGSLLFF